MTAITVKNGEEFFRRFHAFDDAVIEGVGVMSFNDPDAMSIKVMLNARDINEPSMPWVKVGLTFSRVKEFCIRETAKSTASVMSVLGFKLRFHETHLTADFDARSEAPDDNESRTHSDFYIMSEELFFAVSDR